MKFAEAIHLQSAYRTGTATLFIAI